MNGDLRVAYRASPEGRARHRVRPELVHLLRAFPELPSIRGWVEAMASLGRLIFFDQPGTGASDPVAPDALPTLEQWADSITAVLDELGSQRGSSARDRWARCPSGAVRRHPPVSHYRARCVGGLCRGSRDEDHARGHCCPDRHVGHRRIPARDQSRHAMERGDSGRLGARGTPGSESSGLSRWYYRW